MFLTRLGFGSKIVVTGDVTQVDLPTRHQERAAGRPGHPRRRPRTSHFSPPDRARRRAAQAGRHASSPPTTRSRPRARPAQPGRARRVAEPMNVEVLNESGADSRRRGAHPAVPLHDAPHAPAPGDRAVRRAGRRRHDRASSTSSGWASTARPTCCRSRWTSSTPGRERRREPEGYLGDIALCPQVAAQQAPTAGHTTEDELDLLTVHGILHLLGYDHAEPDEEREMFGSRPAARWSGSRPRERHGRPNDRDELDDDLVADRRGGGAGRWSRALLASAEAALSSFSKARAEELGRRGPRRRGAPGARSSTTPRRYLNTRPAAPLSARRPRRAGRRWSSSDRCSTRLWQRLLHRRPA